MPCRSPDRTISSSFTNYIGINICIFDTACNRHSNETVTLRKNVTKYEIVQKSMIKFLRKFENRGNLIPITKYINLVSYFNFVWSWGFFEIEGDFPSTVNLWRSLRCIIYTHYYCLSYSCIPGNINLSFMLFAVSSSFEAGTLCRRPLA